MGEEGLGLGVGLWKRTKAKLSYIISVHFCTVIIYKLNPILQNGP